MTIDIRILKPIEGYSPPAIVRVASKWGVPKARNWRRRLKDAETDGCCEIVITPSVKSKLKIKRGNTDE